MVMFALVADTVVLADRLRDVGLMKEMVVQRRSNFCLLAMLSAEIGLWTAFGAAATKTAGEAFKYEEPRYLTGAIYARGTKQLLFTFKRLADRSGNTLRVQRDFAYPDGKLAARERVQYQGDALVSYELEETQIGAAGSARIRQAPGEPAKGTIEFEYATGPDARTKARTEPLAPDTLIADMVGPFLVSHWDALEHGDKVKCRYIVVPRMETVGFTFRKDSMSGWRGHKVLVVRMEPSSKFVSMLVDPLFFTIETDPPHRVLRYLGRTTPKIQVHGKWKDLDAETIFDWDSAR